VATARCHLSQAQVERVFSTSHRSRPHTPPLDELNRPRNDRTIGSSNARLRQAHARTALCGPVASVNKMSTNKQIQIIRLQEDNRIFVDMPDDVSNPCLSCGACCKHFRISMYIGEMVSHGGTVPDELLSKGNPVIACMNGTETGSGRCTALRGDVGKPGIGCAIYAQRPSACREYRVWLEDGSPNPDCQRLRAKIGLPPLQVHPVGVA
jgi:uncharacterized protein